MRIQRVFITEQNILFKIISNITTKCRHPRVIWRNGRGDYTLTSAAHHNTSNGLSTGSERPYGREGKARPFTAQG